MTTGYPAALDSYNRPVGTDPLSSSNGTAHSAWHDDHYDAIEALEAKVGIDDSAVTTSLDYLVKRFRMLGATYYRPGSVANYSTTSTTLIDLDATNQALTITVPSPGKVLFIIAGGYYTNAGGDAVGLGVRESTTIVTDPGWATYATNVTRPYIYVPILVTGISAGSHTYKVGWKSSSAVVAAKLDVGGAGGNVGATFMAFAVP